MPTRYENREIDQKIEALSNKQDAHHAAMTSRMDAFERGTTETLTRIEVQTVKTNGSVANLKMWRAYITGAIAVLTVLVIPIILEIIAKYL